MNKILPILLVVVLSGCGGETTPVSIENHANFKYLHDDRTNSSKYVEACEKDGQRYIYETYHGDRFHRIDGEDIFFKDLKDSDKRVFEDYRGDKYYSVDCEWNEVLNVEKCKKKYLSEQELKDLSEQDLKDTEDMNKNNALIMKCANKALKDFTESFCEKSLNEKLQIPAYAKAYEKGTRTRNLFLDDGKEFDHVWTVEYKDKLKCKSKE